MDPKPPISSRTKAKPHTPARACRGPLRPANRQSGRTGLPAWAQVDGQASHGRTVAATQCAPRPIRRPQIRNSVLDGDETQLVDLGLDEFGQLEVRLGAVQLVGQFKR